jgi:hypothetical protein
MMLLVGEPWLWKAEALEALGEEMRRLRLTSERQMPSSLRHPHIQR